MIDETPGISSFSRALRGHIEDAGCSFRSLAEDVSSRGTAVSAPTLRSWASGKSQPTRAKSMDVLANLEAALGVGPGMLQRYLEDAVDPDRITDVPNLERITAAADETRRAWGFPAMMGVTRDLTIATLTLDSPTDGWVQYRTVLRAIHGGVDRVLVAVDAMGWEGDSINEHSAILHGAEFGRSRSIGDGICLTELHLPRELAAGEVSVIDLSYAIPQKPRSEGMFRAVCLVPTTRLIAKVTSPPRGLPLMFSRRSESVDGEGPEDRHLDSHIRGGSMDCTISFATAGLATIEWSRNNDAAIDLIR